MAGVLWESKSEEQRKKILREVGLHASGEMVRACAVRLNQETMLELGGESADTVPKLKKLLRADSALKRQSDALADLITGSGRKRCDATMFPPG